MIIHLQLCSITHLCSELPRICLVAEDKTYLEKVGKTCMPGGLNLEGKVTKTWGMPEIEPKGTGKEMNTRKKHGKCWKGRALWKKKNKEEKIWKHCGLVDEVWYMMEEDLFWALHMNFWVTMDHLYHLLVLSFAFCKAGSVVLTLFWDVWMGKAGRWLFWFIVFPLLSQHLANGTLPFHW